ncbi:DNA binding protein [Methylobacterium sp. ME121]|nr:DNA binding protein [Methylobacterium sp. ME121]
MPKNAKVKAHIKDRDFCSVTDAVDYSTLSTYTIHGLIQSKKIDAKKIGRRYLIVVPSLLRFLNEGDGGSEAPPASIPAAA